MHAEPTKRFFAPGEPLRLLPIVFMSLFAVMAAVDAMIALQPSVLGSLRDSWQHWVGAGWIAPSYASVFATGVAMAGVAIAASVLSVFIRGVRSAPYVWLAPIVVGSGAALMARLPVELPVPFSPTAFALISACSLLGGGALIRRDSFATRFSAALVMGMPWSLLAIGYSQAGSSGASHGAGPFIFALALTTFATVALGYATRETPLGDAGGMGERMVELLERARTAEARATFAEQQLASTGGGSFALHSPQSVSDDEALARMRGASSGRGLLWAALLFLIGSLATGYFAGYLPLQNRLDAQHRLLQAKDEQHVGAMTALRARFDAERTALQAQLHAMPAPHVEAPPQSTGAAPLADAATAPAAEPAKAEPKKAEPAKAEPKKAEPAPIAEPHARAKAKVEATTTTSHASAASTHAARPARNTKTSVTKPSVTSTAAAKPAATKAGAAAAKAHYDDDALDDDPIGGL